MNVSIATKLFELIGWRAGQIASTGRHTEEAESQIDALIKPSGYSIDYDNTTLEMVMLTKAELSFRIRLTFPGVCITPENQELKAWIEEKSETYEDFR